MMQKPLDPAQRNQTLDVLHGLALLFVLLVDVHYYHNSLFAALAPALKPVLTGSDRVTALLTEAFVFMKGLMLFAFLFGVSLAIIAERAGAEFGRLYVRRLAGLALLGLLHGAFIWYGGQLLVLSAVGAGAAVLLRPEPRATLRLAAQLFVFGLVSAAAVVLVAGSVPGAAAEALAHCARSMRWEDAAYSGGTYWRIARVRLEMTAGFVPLQLAANGLRMLAAALAGAAVYRLGVFHDPAAWASGLRRLTAASLAAGAAFTGLSLAFEAGPTMHLHRAVLGGLSLYVGSALLAAGYAGGATLLMRNPAAGRLLAPLRDCGRMALTNFLLSSLAFSLTAYPYGLGLYGRVGRLEAAAAALALYAALCAFSTLWLGKFRFGPFEWLLRGLVYRRLPALEIRAPVG